MMADIQEICELIAPRLFGKPYSELTFFVPGEQTKKENCELFQCAAIAGQIRLDAMKSLQLRFPGVSHAWPTLMQVCEELAETPERLALQKQKLRERGFLK